MARPYITIGLSKAEFETICDQLDISFFGKKKSENNPLFQIFFSKFGDKLIQRMKDASVKRMPSSDARIKRASWTA